MPVETLSGLLLWSFVINLAVLVLYFLLFLLAHDWIYRVHGRWFKISVETFDAIHYVFMGGYKTAIFFFTLVPYMALQIIG